MKDDQLYIVHILESIAKIQSYIGPERKSFDESSLIQDAVLRNLQILAESTQRLSDTIKSNHPEINWRGISGMRNVLVHDYLGIDLTSIWDVIQRDLEPLKRAVSPHTDPKTSK